MVICLERDGNDLRNLQLIPSPPCYLSVH